MIFADVIELRKAMLTTSRIEDLFGK